MLLIVGVEDAEGIAIRNLDNLAGEGIGEGGYIRLSAEFSEGVRLPDIESINWTLKEVEGPIYIKPPNARDVDIQLKPNYSGLINVNVSAKLKGETERRNGSTSIQVVQTKPIIVTRKPVAWVALPPRWSTKYAATVELYAGNNEWIPVSGETGIHDQTEGFIKWKDVPDWDGTAYARYKALDGPNEPFQYHALATIPEKKIK